MLPVIEPVGVGLLQGTAPTCLAVRVLEDRRRCSTLLMPYTWLTVRTLGLIRGRMRAVCLRLSCSCLILDMTSIPLQDFVSDNSQTSGRSTLGYGRRIWLLTTLSGVDADTTARGGRPFFGAAPLLMSRRWGCGADELPAFTFRCSAAVRLECESFLAMSGSGRGKASAGSLRRLHCCIAITSRSPSHAITLSSTYLEGRLLSSA